jgi:hypothetical protein
LGGVRRTQRLQLFEQAVDDHLLFLYFPLEDLAAVGNLGLVDLVSVVDLLELVVLAFDLSNLYLEPGVVMLQFLVLLNEVVDAGHQSLVLLL